LDDISEEFSRSSEKLINDPERLALLNQKLQQIYTLQRKTSSSNYAGTINGSVQFREYCFTIRNIGEEIAALTISIQEKPRFCDELAHYNNRTTAVPLYLIS
jgi:DNA repair protein RecN (Recombination protein N)